MSEVQDYYDALKRIARDFMSGEQVRNRGPKLYGLESDEALEFAYDNMREVARKAIFGKRRPTP
jgi:hypothetical protein